MTGKELIAKALSNIALGRAQAQPNFEARLRKIAVERIADLVPEPLQQYVTYAGSLPEKPEHWAPDFFKIEAPEMVEIAFSAVKDDKSLRVQSIRVNGKKYGTDWAAAITAAAEEFERRKDIA